MFIECPKCREWDDEVAADKNADGYRSVPVYSMVGHWEVMAKIEDNNTQDDYVFLFFTLIQMSLLISVKVLASSCCAGGAARAFVSSPPSKNISWV